MSGCDVSQNKHLKDNCTSHPALLPDHCPPQRSSVWDALGLAGYEPSHMVFLDRFIERMMNAPLGRPTVKRKKKFFKLLNVKNTEAPLVMTYVTPQEIRLLTKMAVETFKAQPPLLRINPTTPIHIFGDLHGQFRDLRMMIDQIGLPNIGGGQYLFLGDYVDRGLQGVETFALVLALRCRYPHHVHTLRGNHEDINTAQVYGFYDEIAAKYGAHAEAVWLHIVNAFNWMPLAAIIGGRIMAMHGGLSPHIENLNGIEKIQRPTTVPPYGLACDLLWADPDMVGRWALSPRGISFTFNEQTVHDFCRKHGVDLIVRAHQVNTDMIRHGHKWFADGRLITVFSAPNYLNMGNDGCVLQVNSDLSCKILAFRPALKKKISLRKNVSGMLRKVSTRGSISLSKEE